jgi:hypothetical protein
MGHVGQDDDDRALEDHNILYVVRGTYIEQKFE